MLNEGKRFRHLDLGIFLTPDPLEYVDGFNPYIYCSQNPWGRWDPLGLEGEPSFWSEYKRAFSEQGAHIVSFGVDTLPIVGSIKSASEFVVGKDLITGENVSRLAAVAGVVPFGKNIKGATSGAIKNISEETAEQTIKTLSKESKAKASKEIAEQVNKEAKSVSEDSVKNAMKRGRESEKRVLEDLGETKNTKSVSTSEGISIPDYKNSKEIGEIKDVKKLSDSKQLRIQREVAQSEGKKHTIQTGEYTNVSKPLEKKSNIVRRKDLGPKK